MTESSGPRHLHLALAPELTMCKPSRKSLGIPGLRGQSGCSLLRPFRFAAPPVWMGMKFGTGCQWPELDALRGNTGARGLRVWTLPGCGLRCSCASEPCSDPGDYGNNAGVGGDFQPTELLWVRTHWKQTTALCFRNKVSATTAAGRSGSGPRSFVILARYPISRLPFLHFSPKMLYQVKIFLLQVRLQLLY